jgi:hypothetical protein
MKFSFTSKPVDKIEAELIVLLQFEDDVPFQGLVGLLDWRINGRLSRCVLDHHYSGRAREALLLPAEGRLKAHEIVILGLGRKEAFEQAFVGQVIDHLLNMVAGMKVKQVCLSVGQMLPGHFEWRNAVRLLQSKLFDHPGIQEIILCESEDCIREARKRQMDFSPQVQVEFLGS